MNQLYKFREALALYRKHGWRLVRALMRNDTLAELRAEVAREPGGDGEQASDDADAQTRFEGVAVTEAPIDAMWFTRASAGGREAWELRLVAEAPYALFELFEPDEEEEDRADVRREMEAQLVERMTGEKREPAD